MGKDKKEKKSKKEKEKQSELKANKVAKGEKSEKQKKSAKSAKDDGMKVLKADKKAEKAEKAVKSEKVAAPVKPAKAEKNPKVQKTPKVALSDMPEIEDIIDTSFDAMDFVTTKIGGKWKMKVIYALRDNKSKRYSEIKASVPGITDMMLSSSLKELVEDGLVERMQFSEVPLRVEYQISKTGSQLTPALLLLVRWAINNK